MGYVLTFAGHCDAADYTRQQKDTDGLEGKKILILLCSRESASDHLHRDIGSGCERIRERTHSLPLDHRHREEAVKKQDGTCHRCDHSPHTTMRTERGLRLIRLMCKKDSKYKKHQYAAGIDSHLNS